MKKQNISMLLRRVVGKLARLLDLKITKRSHFDQLEDIRKETLRHQIYLKWNLIDLIDSVKNKENNEPLTCPLCGYADTQTQFLQYQTYCRFGGGVLLRHQCPECDVIFGASKVFRLTNDELSQEYEWHYRVYSEGDSTEQEIRAFYALNPDKNGIYLNYGAGAWSNSVRILRAKGWNVHAYEPHGSASGDMTFISDKEKLLSMKFDGLFSNNVLEHLRNPVEELAFMGSLLKPTAKMSHATPCFEYRFEYTRFHLYFFLGKSKYLIGEKAGFEVENYIEDGDFMNCIYRPRKSGSELQ